MSSARAFKAFCKDCRVEVRSGLRCHDCRDAIDTHQPELLDLDIRFLGEARCAMCGRDSWGRDICSGCTGGGFNAEV